MTTNETPKWADKAIKAGSVFTPTSPIDARALFAGREEQVRLIVDVINQKGQHAMLYGERGVGKTSLANILPTFLTSQVPILAPRINCDSSDTFDSVWRKVFEQVELTRTAQAVGFGQAPKPIATPFIDTLGAVEITPDFVRRAVTVLAAQALVIFIIDEFDRLSREPRRAFADTIKSLSDHSVPATIILVGVADSVEQLIDEHQSVERALVQVRMPRMSNAEITSILSNGTKALDMAISPVATSRIGKLSQGLPHYAHLLGLYSARSALDAQRAEIGTEDVSAAVKRAISGAQQSVRGSYELAVRSPRPNNLFADVLLACALADTNELGFFAAQDARGPLRKVTGKKYDIPSYAQHLNEFCDAKRGPIFQKDGARRLYRYRFLNPLLQPFVIMRGLECGKIKADALD